MTISLEDRESKRSVLDSLAMVSNVKIDSAISSKILSKLKSSKPNLHKHNSQPTIHQKDTNYSKQSKDFRITRKVHRENKDPIVLQSFSILKEEEEPSESKSIRNSEVLNASKSDIVAIEENKEAYMREIFKKISNPQSSEILVLSKNSS